MESFGGPELIVILFSLMALVSIPMFIVALVQCLSANFHEPNNKIIWALVILFMPFFLGPILWWTIGMKQRRLA